MVASLKRSIQARPGHPYRDEHLEGVQSAIENGLTALQATEKYLENRENSKLEKADKAKERLLSMVALTKRLSQEASKTRHSSPDSAGEK